MTSEVAMDTGQAEPATGSGRRLRELIARTECVLFDFDGPICRLFPPSRAREVVERQLHWLENRGLEAPLTSEEIAEGDTMAVLGAVDTRYRGSDLAVEFEAWLTREEMAAARSAYPTEWADPLIRTWHATGCRLAIVTNNSPAAAARYVENRGIGYCFAPHVYGRTHDLDRLKPDPDSLMRGLEGLGADPAATLMIGDSASDCQAAYAAGVSFLGYGPRADKETRLRKGGAELVVRSLEPVLRLVVGRGAAERA
ncbi:HAD family hydrolase [Streptomyces tsukubensis]|uniref:HAD family hydrolase n=1 Tax=Streptomyces tsukubensis TaxID=83656 RepID=UPI001D04FF50|nr:HAD family hydrolase [Streptomyces tsukubensis]